MNLLCEEAAKIGSFSEGTPGTGPPCDPRPRVGSSWVGLRPLSAVVSTHALLAHPLLQAAATTWQLSLACSNASSSVTLWQQTNLTHPLPHYLHPLHSKRWHNTPTVWHEPRKGIISRLMHRAAGTEDEAEEAHKWDGDTLEKVGGARLELGRSFSQTNELGRSLPCGTGRQRCIRGQACEPALVRLGSLAPGIGSVGSCAPMRVPLATGCILSDSDSCLFGCRTT